MSFFLSSPPQPTYQKSHHQSHPQHSFFTPQTHRTKFFSDSVSWPSFQFQPKSPSPLRPSWNAGNVMRRQNGDHTKGDDYQGILDSDLAGWENNTDTGSSAFATYTATSHNTSDAPQLPSNPATTTGTLLTSQHQPQIPTQNETSQTRNPFTFQSHSQLSRPTSQLTSRIRNNRDTRRSLFLDRLRSSRRDERDNSIIEKFEKEEYWRDRRRREERMSREAEVQIDWEDEDVEDDDGAEEEMSPIDEEREVGELVEGWFALNQDQNRIHDGSRGLEEDQRQRQGQEDDFMDGQLDFEDSDFEEVFMQVLSQQEQDQRLGGGGIMQAEGGGGGGGEQDLQHETQDRDRDAEMS